MNPLYKKIIAPVIVTVLMIIFCVVYFLILYPQIEGFVKGVVSIIPLLFTGQMIKVCIERINEIKKGEKDDLSKY